VPPSQEHQGLVPARAFFAQYNCADAVDVEDTNDCANSIKQFMSVRCSDVIPGAAPS
jgi:hypothetical protein